jgi:rubrerythrin
MVIENRNLSIGTRLVANYKKTRYVCTVEAAGEGAEGVAFVLENGKRFKSPSAAGSSVMGGKAVNGWRFWSLEGEAPATTTSEASTEASAEAKTAKAKGGGGKGKKTIYRVPPGPNLGEGKSRWFCVACMKGFVIDGSEPPAACPEGHPLEDLHTEDVAS